MTLPPFRLPTRVPIQEIRVENPRTRTFVLDACLEAEPGQFVMAWLPRFDEKPFSLVSPAPVTLMVAAVGPFTRLLHEKAVGESLWIRGPFGRGFRVPEEQRRLALVGGGYGVAPLLWLARSLQGRAQEVTVLLGARTAQDLLYTRAFQALTQETGPTRFRLLLTTEDGSAGQPGLVTGALEPLLARREVEAIYACGPHGMLEALARLARQHRVPAQLSWEAYMRCALGLCGSCEHQGALLCLDGPVLEVAGRT